MVENVYLNKKRLIGLLGLAVLFALVVYTIMSRDSLRSFKFTTNYSLDSTDILVLDSDKLTDEDEARLRVYSPDLTIRSEEESNSDISKIIIGNIIVFRLAPLDSCDNLPQQIDRLNQQLFTDAAEHKVVMAERALIDTVGNVDLATFLSTANCDLVDEKTINQIISKADLFVSTDFIGSNAFLYEQTPEVDFLQASSFKDSVDETRTKHLRIRSTEDKLVFAEIILNTSKPPKTDLNTLKTYRVEVNEKDLQNIYKTAPLYRPGLNWQLKIEPADIINKIRAPISAKLNTEAGLKNIEFSIRGNVGNHWEGYKKSWDIDFVDTEDRQVKLVIPSDRGYVNQIYIDYLSNALGVPTPSVSLARLIINGVDHGIYLEYEDFDKAFLELRGYNSDAAPSKNYFRDHHDAYDITDNISYTTGEKDDKSQQQNISRVEFTKDNISHYFDIDNFARWVALQVINGDIHQNYSDNFRYFLDKTTGRYVMVTWDITLNEYTGFDNQFIPLAKIFINNPENKALVLSYVEEFYDDRDIHRIELKKLISETTDIFESDVLSSLGSGAVARYHDSLVERYDDNLIRIAEDLGK